MHMLLAGYFSVLLLHSVSAGGVYCAKIARARAATMGLGHPEADDPLGLTHLGNFPSNANPRGRVYYKSNNGPREAQTEFIRNQHQQRAGYPIPWMNAHTAPRGFLPKPALNHPDHDPRHLGKPQRRQVVNHFEPEKLQGQNNYAAESTFNFAHHRNTYNRYEPRSFGYYAHGSVNPAPHDDAVWGGFLQPLRS